MAKQGKYSGKITNKDLLVGTALTWVMYSKRTDPRYGGVFVVLSGVLAGSVGLAIIDRYLGDGFP